ncbi:MAG: efflux RND transporter permease subunit, partial [bacterium]
LQFHQGVDMAEAMAETVNYANRARAYMPAGTRPAFVMRFDSGNVPIGNLVFTSKTRTLAQLQDLVLNTIRPLFATLPGLSAPPPFGASQRSIEIVVDPKKALEYNLSLDIVAEAVRDANVITASGNMRLGKLYPAVPLNSNISEIKELENVPLRLGTYPTVFLKDIAQVKDGSDVQTGYALVNGHRTVYLPVTKRTEASTLAVVKQVRKNLPKFQSLLPDDVKMDYVFDQSVYVKNAIHSLFIETILGTILTGIMVLIFLRDWRSSLIIVLNIPIALLGAVIGLRITGQTINIMTLGGFALAVGILVDESTVAMENIHAHLARGKTIARAALDATTETAVPRFLAMLCILAVFIPSFFMAGTPKALFVPLSLAVGFAMAGAYLLSSSFVPVLSTWMLRSESNAQRKSPASGFVAMQNRYGDAIKSLMPHRGPAITAYLAAVAVLIALLSLRIGTEMFPHVDLGQLQMRLRAPAGTYIDTTESITLKAIDIVKEEVGPENVAVSLATIGLPPPSFPVNNIYLWSSGPHESILQVALKHGTGIHVEKLAERLRRRFAQDMPEVKVSFEPSDIISRVMSQGAPTPVEIMVNSPDMDASRGYAQKIIEVISKIPSLRDIQFGQTLDYPSVKITADRKIAGIHGLTLAKIGRALLVNTSTSRHVVPNFWSNPKTGSVYEIQVEVPMEKINSIDAVKNVLVSAKGGGVPLKNFATVVSSTVMGQYDRFNMQRALTVTANIAGEDMGSVSRKITSALKKIENLKPRGVSVAVRGQIMPMNEMFNGLTIGLLVAIIAIFLLLAANFQSLKLSFVVLSAIPAAITGTAVMLWLTGTTLNVQSFMGAIMTIGVAVANAILLVTFAEKSRLGGLPASEAAVEGARSRLRAILMTSGTMIIGMIPVALGWGEGGQQTTPLGIAVIGGLAAATLGTLTVLPLVYAAVQKKSPVRTASLDPDDPQSAYYMEKTR